MKKKKFPKKLLAIFLSFVMIATSVPLGIMSVAAGAYDPAPKFSEEAITKGARAWLDDDGNVHVAYPAAIAEDTYKGEKLSIAFYILELVDMGANNAAHTKVVLDTIKSTDTSATFKAADIGTIDLESKRYSVTITAVDTENWFSQPIYTTVTDVPVAEIDASRFANFSTSATAVREMATFDGETDSDNTATATGNALLYMGTAAEAGTEDLSDNVGDTAALRFIMNDMPNGTQNFYTSYSRETWDFKGAEEVWYWLDFSKVSIQGMAFTLGSQCKDITGWADGSSVDVSENEVIHYSTKGTTYSAYTGEAPYVYVQREDGGWNKVMMTNGTIDLENFKGYVRVPLKFFCSTENRYITATNASFGTKQSIGTFEGADSVENNMSNWVATLVTGNQILADPAGTCITEALMLQKRYFKHKKGNWTTGNCTHTLGYMPAAAVGTTDDDGLYTQTAGEAAAKRATVNLSAGTITRNENTYRAIEDLKTMGFSFENCSADSLQNSFFVDNVFFYRSDGGAYPENTLNDNPNTGSPMSTYYDEEAAISKIIFDEIDKHISDPDWADYRQLEYILELIEEYRALYVSQGKDTSFLNLTRQPDTTGLAGMAAAHNRTDTWEKAWLAYEACATEGTIDASQANVSDWFISNGDKYDLVPSIVNTMEKLPHPDSITAVSEALRKEIVKLWQAYSLLNLGQLEMLGADQEATLIKYFALVENLEELDGDEFVVGQRLADNPFIVFNDFENFMLGETAWQLEDNKDAYTTDFTSTNGSVAGTSNLANDWRHTKSLVTYTTNSNTNITDKDYYGYVTTDSDKSQEAMDGKVHYNASTATITNDGYLHSKGVNLYSDSSFTTSEQNGAFHTITITKDGQPIGTNYENNMVSEQLGSLAQAYTAAASTSVPLALIFYVDFTQIENFYFTVNVFTRDGDGNHVKCRVNTGLNNADRKYWILDNETGEWEIIYTTNQWVFNSAGNQEESANQGVDYNKIEGYKGYLMIPLYHIKKYNSLVSEDKLDENATLLNNIFAIQFCVGGASATDMDEKSIIIDNVGFTYSKDSYSMASSRNDPCYAEVFGAKSLTSANFEKMVDEIDPYEKSTLQTEVTNALAVYNSLSSYQQSLVQEEKDLLDLYLQYVAGTNSLPKPAHTPEQVTAYIDTLPDVIKNATVTGENDIPYPGFSNGAVNYAAMGITRETADEIISYYQESYTRFSKTQKATITNSAQLINAYNMCMRMTQTLEDIKDASLKFLPELTALYTAKYDYDGDGVLDDFDESVADSDAYKVGNFVSIAGREEVETFKTDKYNPLQYYSKTSIDDGSIYPQLQNTSRGFTYFLNNTKEFVVNGETIEGGIITFQKKMQDIYDMANDHITNKTLFTDAELQSVRDIINEYNAMLPAYYNVEELYELEQKIINLFPVVSTESLDATEIMLTEDKLTGETSTYKVTYSEILDHNNTGDNYFVRITSTNGAMTNGYGDSVTYNIAINSDTITSDAIVTDNPYTATVNNNTYTSANPMNYTITPSLGSAPKGLSGTIRDTIIVELVLTEDGVTTVIEQQSIEVSYSMGDAYVVTIPASFPVEWDDSTPQDVSYSVTTEMVATSKLTVGVTSDGTGKMASVSDASLTLDYTTENFVNTEFGNRETDATPNPAPTVTVSGWDDVPVGEYKTILTYTVEYDDGTE